MYTHLFPYEEVEKNSRIIIYGIGQVGQEYCEQLLSNVYCNILCVIDNFSTMQQYKGIRVHRIDEVRDYRMDYIVIAIADETLAKEIREGLQEKGIENCKIIHKDHLIQQPNSLETVQLEKVQFVNDTSFIHIENNIREAINGSNMFLSVLPESYVKFGQMQEYEQLREVYIQNNEINGADLCRLWMLMLNINKVIEDQVEGSFAEVGVYRGNTAAVLSHYSEKTNRRLYLFDTFSGFAEKDLVGMDGKKRKAFSETSLEYVRSILENTSFVQYKKGYFPETVDEECREQKYAFVHLDCDLYKPIKAGLQFYWNRMNIGGRIVIHDYSSGHYDGCKKAVDEFCREQGVYGVLIPDRSGSIVFVKQHR